METKWFYKAVDKVVECGKPISDADKYLNLYSARLCIDCDRLTYVDACGGDTSEGPWHCDHCTERSGFFKTFNIITGGN